MCRGCQRVRYAADAVRFVSRRGVRVPMRQPCAGMARRESEKSHRRHTSGAEHDAKNVQVHLSFECLSLRKAGERGMQNIPARTVTGMLLECRLLRNQ
jgi:hypothetical protein